MIAAPIVRVAVRTELVRWAGSPPDPQKTRLNDTYQIVILVVTPSSLVDTQSNFRGIQASSFVANGASNFLQCVTNQLLYYYVKPQFKFSWL